MKDFIVRQGDEMLNFLIKKFDMINVYLNELEEYGSTSNTDMGNMDDVDSIVQSLYNEDILYRKHYDYDTLYNLVWKAMDKAAKIANQKYNNKQINTNQNMKINESQLRKIIKESINNMLSSEKMLLQYHVKHNGRFEVKELIHVCDPNKTTQENLNDAYEKALKMGLVNDKQIRWKMIK